MGTTLTMLTRGNFRFGADAGLYMHNTGFTPDDVTQAEADALIAFYNATGGDDWTDNTGWGSDKTVGNWYGVTVSGGAVTQIDLSGNNLTTNSTDIAIPDYSALSSLTNLDLSDNSFGQSVVDSLLPALDTSGLTNVTADISGSNSAPGESGVTAMDSLIDNGWTITRSTVAVINTGTFRLATADGSAVVYSSATDLSGNTSNYIRVEDSAGKVAVGYGYQADGAESLESELVTNGTFDDGSNWSLDAGWTIGSGVATADGTLSADIISSSGKNEIGKLYYTEFDIANLTTGKLLVYIGGSYIGTAPNANGSYSYYYNTYQYDNDDIFRGRIKDGFDGDIDNVSVKEVTALGTDALQIRDAATGSTRNWTDVESGFDPNDIAKVEVFNV